jgi:uncharacterized protein YkwD
VVRPAVARPSAPSLAPAASPVAVSHATEARRADPGAAVVVLLVTALLALLLPGATPPAAASGDAEAGFVAAVNGARGAAGLPALQVAGDLVAVARQHASRMAGSDHLHHNGGLGGAVGGWDKIGENVGHGPDVADLHAAFLASPSHRANILDPEWTEIGVGVVADAAGDLWVTQVFRLPTPTTTPAAPSAPPASEPAAGSGTDGAAASEPPAATEPPAARDDAPAEPPPAPVREVVEVAPAADRVAVVLARIDAADATPAVVSLGDRHR